MRWPAGTGAVREALAGEQAWIVGGTVRDALLDRETADLDVAVAGDPETAARRVARAIGGPVFALSERFGAWRALDRRRRLMVDVSRLQGDGIEADLLRRDFGVNAMAVPLAGGEVIDPTGGRADLAARRLRVLGADTYREDPLRPLRLVRLAAELDFAPDDETEVLTRAAAARTTGASGERIWAELRRIMTAPGVVPGLRLGDRLGVLGAVLPEIAQLRGVEQSKYHHLDVFDHTIEVVERQIELEVRLAEVFGPLAARVAAVLDEPLADELTRGQALRLGALLHDVAKPATRGVRPDGRITFIGHDSVGDEMIGTICRRLRTSDRLRSFLGALARHHLVLGFLVHRRPLSRRDVYRYLKHTSPVEVEVTLLSCADRLATRGAGSEEAIDVHLELARELMSEALEWRAAGPPRPPLRGDELAAELGIEPGPEVGVLLAQLEEAAYAGEARSRAEALELARRLREGPAR